MNGLSENESSVHPSIDGKRNIYSSKGSKNVGTPVVFKVCSRMPAAHASKTIMRESASASTIQLLHANEDRVNLLSLLLCAWASQTPGLAGMTSSALWSGVRQSTHRHLMWFRHHGISTAALYGPGGPALQNINHMTGTAGCQQSSAIKDKQERKGCSSEECVRLLLMPPDVCTGVPHL
jgi:hypothetical protein